MKKVSLLLLAALVFFSYSREAAADFYKYKDEKGLVHLTNDISTIPEKFRSRVRIIKDDALAQEKDVDFFKKEQIIRDVKKTVHLARVEVEKFWWRWIVDPESGATKAPVIIGCYLIAAVAMMIFIRRHLSGRLYKVAMKAVLVGFAAIIILTYSAHRGHRAYLEFKKSPLSEMAAEVLEKRRE
ncbi:MAG: hypothetical protein OEV42_13570 [Deltaproteobacteria bacterium]|nr:hypothetical protein [Deltaproteobacteria bacterium]